MAGIQSYLDAAKAYRESSATDEGGQFLNLEAHRANPEPTLPDGWLLRGSYEGLRGQPGTSAIYGNQTTGEMVDQYNQPITNLSWEDVGKGIGGTAANQQLLKQQTKTPFDFQSLLVPALFAAATAGTSGLAGGGFGFSGAASNIFGSGAPEAMSLYGNVAGDAFLPGALSGIPATAAGTVAGDAFLPGALSGAAATGSGYAGADAAFSAAASLGTGAAGAGAANGSWDVSGAPASYPNEVPGGAPNKTFGELSTGMLGANTAAEAGGVLTPASAFSNLLAKYPSAASALDALSGNSRLAGAAGSVGAMPWGSLGNIASLGSSAYGMYLANQQRKMAQLASSGFQPGGAVSAAADPWGAVNPNTGTAGRGVADTQLQTLLKTGDVTGLPGYAAGLQAVQRSMAAQGYTGSGNMMAALSKYGGDFYNNAIQQLSQISGATQNPGINAQIANTGANINLGATQSANDLASRSLASLGYGLSRTQPNMLEQFAQAMAR